MTVYLDVFFVVFTVVPWDSSQFFAPPFRRISLALPKIVFSWGGGGILIVHLDVFFWGEVRG